MLRETQMAGARINNLTLSSATFGGGIFLDIPLHKAAQGGQQELTRRSLRCVYAAAIHLLYPACAARCEFGGGTLHPGTSGIPGGAIAYEEGEQLGGGRPSGRTGGRGRRARVVMNFWTKVLRLAGLDEDNLERHEWVAKCGWPYGVRQLLGLSGRGPGEVLLGTGRYEEKTVDGVKRVFPVDANVADAVSRDDFARARREGWTGVQTPASETMCIPAKSVGDFFYLVDEAALDLVSCSPAWLAEPVRCVARCAGWC
ncbi:unnamed protein product [Symbiodinium necroappetens]|uniref:Uncharacterized protein n=1 Tax=Symbiodinium necroappetens TaxID=1628268 RepID=A0A812IT97_9DINO|nr:unnamed protein product [Symbiodinium necroappetens]